MTDLSPKAQKAQDEARARWGAQQAFFDAGPQLVEGGKFIIIPSPAQHDKFKAVLLDYGFTFVYADIPGPMWRRATIKPHNGRRYSAQGWLDWARKHYAKAWPLWAADQEKGQTDE